MVIMNNDERIAQLRHRLARIAELNAANMSSPDRDSIIRLLDAEAYYVNEMIDVYSRVGERRLKILEP
jgi:hypothetical protein